MMLLKYPMTTRFTLFFIVLLTIFLLSGQHLIFGGFAKEEGSLRISGISNPVNILRDEHGVVSIEAQTDKDVFFAMGFVHAQDRMWQLELQRRVAAGRLSEVFGQQTIGRDTWMRTLGLYPAAEHAWQTLSGEAKSSLSAYADGVNAWMNSGAVLPSEFHILGIEPQPWTEIDSLAWSKVFSLNLSSNLWREIEYLTAANVLDGDQLQELFKRYPQDAPTTVINVQQPQGDGLLSLYGLKQQLETDLQIGGQYVGSNSWVVSGKLTDHGNPILANDPHLGLQIPSQWYVVKQKGNLLEASGMSLVGLPLVIFGKNQHIAWGGTNMYADVQDLYIEKINPQNPLQYHADGQWQNFDTRTEVIKVKIEFPAMLNMAIEPVEVKFRTTVHGPVISDVVDGFDQTMSLSWTALQAQDTTYDSFLKLNYAANWPEFKTAISHFVAPVLNMLYIDIEGNIGYLGAGRIPIRSFGEGQFPMPGWERKYAWSGYIPANEMPQSFNPQQGYIISANNKVVDDNYPYFISHDWASPTRAKRIESMITSTLAKSDFVTTQDMKSMQTDVIDLSAKKMLVLVKKLKSSNPLEQEALGYLSRWDGQMSKQSQAATIYHVWMKYLRSQLFTDELKGYWNQSTQSGYLDSIGVGTTSEQIYSALTERRNNWCDDAATKEVTESCEVVMQSALELAVKELVKLRGGDIDDWAWGEVHTAVYKHSPFSGVSVLATLYERRVASGGSTDSVNVANARYQSFEGYVQNLGATFRQVIQMSEQQSEHFYMNSTGQSGHWLSEHYDDMLQPFHDGIFFSLDGFASPQNASVQTLTLEPKVVEKQ